MRADMYTVCVYVYIHMYSYNISFGYKFYERISSLNTETLLKRAGSRVKGFVLGSKLPSPELALNTKSSRQLRTPGGHWLRRGPCWAVRGPLFQVMGI